MAAIAAAIKWYYQRGQVDELRKERAFTEAILKKQEKVKMAIVESEKRAEHGKKITEEILAGRMSVDDLNRLRSGKSSNN